MLQGYVPFFRLSCLPSHRPDHLPQIPEKLRPYKYDIFGSSHQILHVAVILAGLAHMFGLFRAFQNIHQESFVCG